MKFLHTGDLHIGKTVYDFSMLEEQRHILTKIAEIAEREAVDAVVIAGDVYDRSIPSTEAVNVLDAFLTRLTEAGIRVFLISGNHDSPERVGFADKILEKQGLYIGGCVEEELKQVTMQDSYGSVTFVLLPFTKPAVVGAANCGEAVELLLKKNGFGPDRKRTPGNRYVLVTHFFVTGSGGCLPELSDSETTVHVGGLEQVGAEVFAGFDYVALGHIHKMQRIGEGNCYYAGSPLKYSFSECSQTKGVWLVTMEEETTVISIPLQPIHEMRIIKGTLAALLQQDVVDAAPREDYIQAVLTDEEELLDPMGTLRSVYPNMMQIRLDKNERKETDVYETRLTVQGRSPLELFKEFYAIVKEEPLDTRREQIVQECFKKAGKGEWT